MDFLPRPNHSHCYIYREAANLEELRALIRLRYAVYRVEGLHSFSPEHPSGMELDRFDVRARHLGLFRCSHEGEVPIGYMRVVEPGLVEGWKRFLMLTEEYPDLRERVCSGLEASSGENLAKDFPSTAHSAFPALDDALAQIKSGERLCDCGRFVVEPSARLDVSLGRFATEAAIARYFVSLGFEHSAISCNFKHAPFYERYGYRYLDGEEEHQVFKVPYALMWARPTWIPSKHLPRLQSMARAYEEFGRICYDPNRPGEFGPP